MLANYIFFDNRYYILLWTYLAKINWQTDVAIRLTSYWIISSDGFLARANAQFVCVIPTFDCNDHIGVREAEVTNSYYFRI